LVEKEIVDSAISAQIEFREIWQILDQHQSSYVRQAIVRNSDEFENFETFDSRQMHQSGVGDLAGVTEIEVFQVLHRDELDEAVVVDEGLPLAASQVEVGQAVAVGRQLVDQVPVDRNVERKVQFDEAFHPSQQAEVVVVQVVDHVAVAASIFQDSDRFELQQRRRKGGLGRSAVFNFDFFQIDTSSKHILKYEIV
jgi:hypothetical protein